MCGIVGFTGNRQAAPVLLDGLSKLEYRGYDSAGIAVRDGDKETEIIKEKGKLKVLSEMTDNGKAVKGCCGIGHTRWATHGEPSAVNAHPHASDDENVIAVHNGIIENYQELREKLIKKGYTFKSQTDTEVAVKLVDYYYKKYAPLPIEAIARAMVRIRGSYALCVMFKDYPGEIYCARKDSPMIIGIADGETYVASDVPAILKYTRNVYYIGNMEIAKLEKGNVTFFNIDSEVIEKPLTEIKWDAESAEKGGYEHFMLKEIMEQPAAVRSAIASRIRDGEIQLDEFDPDGEALKGLRLLFRREIPFRRVVFPGDAVQETRNQFPAEEKGGVRTLRQTVVPDAKIAGVGKAAFAVKQNIALKAQRAAAQGRRPAQGFVQQHFPIALPLVLWRDADGPHGHDGDASAIVRLNPGPHEHVLPNQPAVLFHDKIQLLHKGRVLPQPMQHEMLLAARTVYVPEGFPH